MQLIYIFVVQTSRINMRTFNDFKKFVFIARIICRPLAAKKTPEIG